MRAVRAGYAVADVRQVGRAQGRCGKRVVTGTWLSSGRVAADVAWSG